MTKMRTIYQACMMAFLVLCACNIQAQSYTTALGVRVGKDLGISLQQRIADKTTIEGIYYGALGNDELLANVLVEQHFPIVSKRLNFYAGVGVGLRYLDKDHLNTWADRQLTIPTVIGLESTFGRLTLSADMMPHYIPDLESGNRFYNVAGVSVRYVLIKRKVVKKDSFIDKITDTIEDSTSKSKKKKKKKKKN